MIAATYSQKGFSLLELVFVVVILGILAAMAVPKLGDFLTGSKDNVDLPQLFGPLFKLVNSSIYSLLYYPLALRPDAVV